MKLTDREQVILKAIGSSVAEVSRVIRAVGYPKATTKKVLVRLSEKGVVSLHRHDWPQSLTPEQRKLMVRIGRDYFNAVSMRKRNPKSKGKTALKKTGRALKGFARGALQSGAEILGAGAMALNPSRKRKRAAKKPNKTIIKAKRIDHLDVAKVHNPRKRKSSKKRNLDHRDSKHQVEVRRHWRAGGLSQWQRAHKAGQTDLFAHGIKARNPSKVEHDFYNKMLAILARDPHDSHAAGAALTAGKRLGYTAGRIAKDIEKAKGVKRNAARTISSKSSKTRRAGASRQSGRRKAAPKVRSVAKIRTVATRRASSNPTRKGMRKGYREAKRISKVTRGRYFSSESGQRKAARHEKQQAKKGKRNPSAESIRKTFAGSVSGERDLFFPQGTPAGKLAKLGKLVSITTEAGTIKPVHGTAWLCADTKGKLHIGATSNAPLYSGPARNFGHVTKLEYESSKPHLGYGPTIWFHKAGEENGIRPTLRADGKGGLVFKGGAYRLTERGIEN